MNYLYWKVYRGERVCKLGGLQNIEDEYELARGISRMERWPEDACYYMDKKRKEDIRLEDCLWNIDSLLVISSKLKEFLEKENLKNNEYLPLTIFNHKDRPTKESYFIVNQIHLQDCIDQKKSKYDINDIDPWQFSEMGKLVIDEKKIEPEVALFRMNHYPYLPIIRRDLAKKITSAGFTGIRFGEIETYDEGV